MEHSLDKSQAVLIDTETGKRYDLGEVSVTHMDGGPLLPDDLLPKDFDAQKSYTWTLKLSKRKGRKLQYAMEKLINPRPRKYYSKREKIKIIHDLSKEKGLGYIMDSDEVLMRYSSKHLLAIITHLAYLSERSSV